MQIKKLIISINILFAAASITGGCKVLSGEELQPSFLYIDTFSLTADPATEGFPSYRITDAWVYLEGLQLGVFELPTAIPILDSGLHTLSIFPGIKDNGISGTGAIYPFYKGYTYNTTLIPFITDSVSPATEYIPSANFFYMERFETGNSLSELGGSDTGVNIITDPALVFEGSRSASIVLENTAAYARVGTAPMLFPPVGQTLYFELDYRNNIELEIWLTGNYTGGVPIGDYVLTLTPKDTWNKVYINLTYKIQFLQAETYNLEFRAVESSSVEKGEIYIDNLKLISF